MGLLFAISIHAAREGGDRIIGRSEVVVHISIHAAREGGDLQKSRKATRIKRFQSTPPVKAATIQIIAFVFDKTFQSTPPVKAATLFKSTHSASKSFQSTPPVKAAT